MGRMYENTKSWNPYVGCDFDPTCIYCKVSFQAIMKRQPCELCQQYKPHEHPDRLDSIPTGYPIVFICACGDISWAHPDFVKEMLVAVRIHQREHGKRQTFYLQSKNPECFRDCLHYLNDSFVLVTTLETNRDEGYDKISGAPPPTLRWRRFMALEYKRKIVTVEPVMDFDLEPFLKMILDTKCEKVYIGYNSRPSQVHLPEPPIEKVLALARGIREAGIEVVPKDLRGWEDQARGEARKGNGQNGDINLDAFM